MTTTTAPVARNVPLLTARVLAGLLGAAGLIASSYFMFIIPDEVVWKGPWLDVPIVALLLTGALLKLGLGVLPGLPDSRRIAMGFLAAGIGIAVTLVKVPVYDEPEGVGILVFDLVLLVLLTLARRNAARGEA
jgi:hypothetical protein